MKIAIIGAGFTGLSASYQLLKMGHTVTIFEKDALPGGLAIGYKEKGWDWTLEYHYHHWFTNDEAVLSLAAEINHNVVIKRPRTSVFIDKSIYQLDSPAALLSFSKLTLIDRVRMAGVFALLFRFNPFWQPLEKFSASKYLPKLIGKTAYKTLWEPQLRNKMGKYIDEISLAWFWARIKKRTPSLAYPEEGYLAFANHLVEAIKEKGGIVIFNSELVGIKTQNGRTKITTKNINAKQTDMEFDKIIVTLPSFLFTKMAPQLPQAYVHSLSGLRGLGATNLVLRLKNKFMRDGTYWLSVCDDTSKVMVIVEHTNFMDKKHYNNEHLVYIGNYMPTDDLNFSKSKEELLKIYDPFLTKINPEYKKDIIDYEVFRAPFAQPIIPINYSKMIPPLTTPLTNVYLANMQQVYPWDRGTNYAVELGEKVSKVATK